MEDYGCQCYKCRQKVRRAMKADHDRTWAREGLSTPAAIVIGGGVVPDALAEAGIDPDAKFIELQLTEFADI